MIRLKAPRGLAYTSLLIHVWCEKGDTEALLLALHARQAAPTLLKQEVCLFLDLMVQAQEGSWPGGGHADSGLGAGGAHGVSQGTCRGP
jgi:hypothetical protein